MEPIKEDKKKSRKTIVITKETKPGLLVGIDVPFSYEAQLMKYK
jgi:hypothetical protein